MARTGQVVDRLIPAHAGKTSSGAHRASGGQAHPRSRGENPRNRHSKRVAGGSSPLTRENCDSDRFSQSAHGSSPLTRGKPVGELMCSTLARLIPAHAGKTACARASTSRPSAHPRSRGENGSSARTLRQPYGSSPLTRGKLTRDKHVPVRQRLIPAHAGKTHRIGQAWNR